MVSLPPDAFLETLCQQNLFPASSRHFLANAGSNISIVYVINYGFIMNKKLRSASDAVITGGVIVSVLLYKTEITYSDDRVRNITAFEYEVILSKGCWKNGFEYIISGILGHVAANFQNKFMYVLTCCVASRSFNSMIIFTEKYCVFFYYVIFANRTISNYCIDVIRTCACRYDKMSSTEYKSTPFKTCADLENYVNEKYDKVSMTLLFVFLILTSVADVHQMRMAGDSIYPGQPTPGVVIATPPQRILHRVPHLIPQGYGQPGSDITYQAKTSINRHHPSQACNRQPN